MIISLSLDVRPLITVVVNGDLNNHIILTWIVLSFLVASDNTIYEGRGWHFSATKDPLYKHYDGKSLDICFIGDFTGNCKIIASLNLLSPVYILRRNKKCVLSNMDFL
jgi:hypothetical protein